MSSPSPSRRGLFAAALLLALVLIAGGVGLVRLGTAAASDPAGVVRGYFSALAAADAPRALAYGDVPPGPHRMLTTTVLRLQQHTAPLRGLIVGPVRRSGTHATVTVQYVLAFPGVHKQIEADVPLHRVGADWRLDAVAVRTGLRLNRAEQRATAAGAPLPRGATLVFPGALPIAFDSPYLQLDPGRASVAFGADAATIAMVEVSPAGARAARAAVTAQLRQCLAGRAGKAGPTCPVPSDRFVPGSLRGRLASAASPASSLVVVVADGASGLLSVTGELAVVGTYRTLTFENRPVTGHGRVLVRVAAAGYATAPLHMRWTSS